MKKITIMFACFAWALNAQASLVVSESFDYAAGNVSTGTLNGGTGFDGAWTLSNDNTGLGTIDASGLSFTGVSASGLSYTRTENPGNSQLTRTISAASQTSLTADGSTIWFSALVGVNNFSTTGTRPAFIFGDAGFNSSRYANHGGDGLGFSVEDNGGIYAVGWTESNRSNSTGSYDTGLGATESNTYLVVGSIDWNTSGVDDVVSIWAFADGDAITVAGSADATLSLDLDNSTFDTISWTDNQSNSFDEIRMGTTFESVVVPEPSTVAMFLGILTLSFTLLRRRK